jgi:glycosyltransferase involved in cell wall biosynthesis
MPSAPAITAVITTRDRAAKAIRAAESVLRQDPPVLELFVCDDGSHDDTAERLARLADNDPRVVLHRFDPPRGGPGPGRNLAIDQARGDWIAFLDDDDEWLPGKLAAQGPYLTAGRHDLVAGNAARSSGPLYFPQLTQPLEPTRRQLLHVNPVIISSAVVRRDLLRRIGGFADLPWLRRGPLDYHTWLRLSDASGRFIVLPEPLVRYDDPSDARLSSSALKIQRDLLRVAWGRWKARPSDAELAEAAVRHSADTALVAGGVLRHRVQAWTRRSN